MVNDIVVSVSLCFKNELARVCLSYT